MSNTKRRWVAVGIGLVAAVILGVELMVSTPASFLARPTPDRYIPNGSSVRLDQFTIFFMPDTATGTRSLLVDEIHGALIAYDFDLHMAEIRIPKRQSLKELQQLIDEMNTNKSVRFAAPDATWQAN